MAIDATIRRVRCIDFPRMRPPHVSQLRRVCHVNEQRAAFMLPLTKKWQRNDRHAPYASVVAGTTSATLDGDSAPTGLRHLVRQELRRAFRPPYLEPTVVVVNGLLMTGAWFLLPERWRDALFSLHGTFAFALILASWMYADVPATNVLGIDASRARDVLDDPAGLDRLLDARMIVLWLLVTPICVLVAFGIGVYESEWARMALTIVAIAIPPFGALGIAACLGIRWPYHAIPLVDRWRRRRPFGHMWVRWSVLVLLPFVVVPFLTVLALVPSFAIWAALGKGLDAPLSELHFVAGGAVTIAVSVAMWLFGRRLSHRLVRRRREALDDYLADPTRG
jgi:hypothetical protein